jgi:hypothetical protein
LHFVHKTVIQLSSSITPHCAVKVGLATLLCRC